MKTNKPQQKQRTTQNRPNTDSAPRAQQTFLEHVYELRSRLFWIMTTLVAMSALAFHFKDALVAITMAPLHGQKLVYLTPGGGFSFIFTVCLYFGLLATIPLIIYHLYRFLQPVFGKTSRLLGVWFVILSILLAAGGAAFGYFVAVPAALSFLTGFAGDMIAPNLTAESYLGFIVAYMLGLAALFQLPLVLYIADHVRPFKPGTLISSQRYVIAGAVIAAAIITPTPDIVNQMIVAGPVVGVYQIGVVTVYSRRRLGGRKKVQTHGPAQQSARTIPEIVVREAPQPQATPRVVLQQNKKVQSVQRMPQRQVIATKPVSTPRLAVRQRYRSIDGIAPRRVHDQRLTRTYIPSRPRQVRSIDGMVSVPSKI